MRNKRKLTLNQAKARYPHRYTMEHCPRWAIEARFPGKWYAPQYATDREWYENTVFPGERGLHGNCTHCQSSNPTWPLGQWLDVPYSQGLAKPVTP